MADVTAVLDNFLGLSEFWGGVTDACGEDACIMALHALYGTPPLTGPEVVAFRSDMAAHGINVSGGTTLSSLASYCNNVLGRKATLVNPYGSSADAIHQTLLAHAGRDGIVLQVTAAHNLPGNEGGVNSHFVAIGGISPQGYLVGNGDDVRALAANNGHGKTYAPTWISWSALLNASPAGVIVFPNPKGSTQVALPATWKDDGKSLSNPTNGNVVQMGFRTWILAHEWDAADVPLENEHGVTGLGRTDGEDGTAQLFTNSGLRYQAATGVRRDNIGQQLADARAALAKATTPPPTQLTDAQKAAVSQAIQSAGALADRSSADQAAARAVADALAKAFGS